MPRAHRVFEPAAPYLKTLAISCQPTLLFDTIAVGPSAGICDNTAAGDDSSGDRGVEPQLYALGVMVEFS